MLGLIIFLVLWYLLIGVGMMKLFEKTDKQSWQALVPIYNLVVWAEIVGRKPYYLLLLLVPIVNIFIFSQLIFDLLKSFDKYDFQDHVFGILGTPIYFFYLGQGHRVRYEGPATDMPKIQKTMLRDWTDSIIFAVVAATFIRWFLLEAFTIPTSSMEKSLLVGDFLFVSKVHYGPRIPITPISFPFAHNEMPVLGGKSYSTALQLEYSRMNGFETIDNNEVVVFNYPQDPLGQAELEGKDRKWRPIDKKDNYIKRCVGIPGDSLKIVDQIVFINGEELPYPEKVQFLHEVKVNKYGLKQEDFLDCNISLEEFPRNIQEPNRRAFHHPRSDLYYLNMTRESAELLRALPNVGSVEIAKRGKSYDPNIFPYYPKLAWNVDNYGPIYIPKAGDEIELNEQNYHLYNRNIREYEHVGLSWNEKEKRAYIDGQPADTYTFKMNYYFMMGDNRHNSADSRMWGFVPEDHVVGKALFVWFSYDKWQSMPAGIRWNRMFSGID